MESLLGLLRIRVKRGVNLAVRDVRSSDPYVVVKLGPQVRLLPLIRILSGFVDDFDCLVFLMQRLKTRVIKRDVNPEWNEDLTLSISDPNACIKLVSPVLFIFAFIWPLLEYLLGNILDFDNYNSI